jgi:hypothetical protein
MAAVNPAGLCAGELYGLITPVLAISRCTSVEIP